MNSPPASTRPAAIEEIARLYLGNARDGYLRWGADAKVRQLDEAYPHLRDRRAPRDSASTIGTAVEQLDLATVIKVSQAISSEILLDKTDRHPHAHSG